MEGMNKDTSPNKYSNKQYYDLKNMRLITDDDSGLTSGSLVNIKGNSLAITVPDNGIILGSTQLRNELFLFVKGDTADKIYKIPKSSLSTAQDLTLRDNYYFDDTIFGFNAAIDTLVYKGILNFSVDYKVKAISNYENIHVQKLYWVDGLNPLKHINIVYDEDSNDLVNMDESLLDISPPHVWGQLSLEVQTGGNLKAGRVQYAYQLYTPNGSETMYSPASDLINITKENAASAFDKQAGGSDIETVSGKSVEVEITLTSDYANFNRIRLVALDYYGVSEIPSVRIVSEATLSNDIVIFRDYGYSLGSMILEEFRFIQNELIPTTFTVKKNNLYVGNIIEEFFDVDELGYIDTRAYRSKETGVGTVVTSHIQDYALPTVTQFLITHNGTGWNITVESTIDEIPDFIEVTNPVYGEYVGGVYLDYLEVTVDPGGLDDLILLDISDPATYEITHDEGNNLISISGHGCVVPPTSNGPNDFYDIPDMHAYTVRLEAISFTYTKTEALGSAIEQCIVNHGMSNEVIINTSTYSVSSEDDCINTYNNLVNDPQSEHQFIYKPGTALTTKILGGEGKIVSYEFVDDVAVNGFNYTTKDSFPYLILDSTYPGYFDEDNVMDYTGHQRDEVYRYGIEFYDLDGRKAFPKWIGDIRFPNKEQSNYNGTNRTVTPLGIKVTLNWSQLLDNGLENPLWNIKDQISGYRIIRAPREEADKTIKAQGIINPTADLKTSHAGYELAPIIASGVDYTNTTTRGVTGIQDAGSNLSTHIVNFYSPQIAYNKTISDNGNSFVEIIGYLSNVEEYGDIFDDGDTDTMIRSYAISSGSSLPNDLTSDNRWDTRQTVSSQRVLTTKDQGTADLIIDTHPIHPRVISNIEPFLNEGYTGTSLLIELDNTFLSAGVPAGADTNKALVVNYRTYLGYSQYGGAEYSARSVTGYIPAGKFEETPVGTTSTQDIYNGDTYICNFTQLVGVVDPEGAEGEATDVDNTLQSVASFVVETSMNLAYKTDPMLKYINFKFDTGTAGLDEDYYALTDKESDGILLYPNKYPSDLGDLYRYNTAYSAYDKSYVSVPKPFDFKLVTEYDYRIYASEKKFPGEYSDSWLNFKANNFRDIDAEYGALTRIINHKDTLVFFQPKGIGVISSYDREVVTTESNQKLALGTGGLLERYDYVDTGTGTSIYESISSTGGVIMYYDDLLKQIKMVTKTTEPTSEIKGLKSYFNGADIVDLITGYDFENREVLFSPTNIETPTTVFSGFLNAFTGFYEFNDSTTPVQIYTPLDELLLSSHDNNKIYLHNVGEYGVFYDGTPKESSIAVIVNPLQIQPITYHVASWLSSVLNPNYPDLVDETVDTLRITNTYQDTGVINLVPGTNITRRLRTWRINELRDSISEEGRLRDSYMKIDLGYNNTDNYRFILSDLLSTYRPTKIR